MILLALLGCKDAADDSAACGSTQGFIAGVVYDVDGETPIAGATVIAEGPDGAPIEALTDADGNFELALTGGETWTLGAQATLDGEDCFTEDITVDLGVCQELEQDIVFEECLVARKPNLYLYPSADTPTAVQLELAPGQRVVASEPPYRGAWRGVAHPDGSFSVGSTRAPFLFYEVSLTPAQSRSLQREAGWCLPAGGAVEAMAELLAEYGFNAAEREDFIEGWEHDLPPALGYAVYPQLSVAPLTGLHLQPALPVERLWLLVGDGAGCALQAPPILPFDRKGPHGVEWGVILEGL
ncbi:MAG: carboxypeptidase regulatory-like domain-containing protein [Alphaproteobacteria bacterium]|nr:carboxypeptidase regulatory-like domain-containing protein [Alphaproteobacteria bacterium]